MFCERFEATIELVGMMQSLSVGMKVL